ncbi:helix-turn-helix domain-containing protein [Pontibacillus sp. HMF3514]|uniref:helix-turn-helix domain-containing protein n=1 Tax=Pontibacillus sp. HMF3514 TaxID=2692425 RepID=UPI00131F98EE|nr:helix-turn-helix transcriptional regulator [Pontibacillus sp. HMF3514]QHE52787.1 helix-turn-helix domain-containing protein [Pontibacillus sp. HMF3514]
MKLEEVIGDVLKRYRKSAGLSQEELALRCDLDRTYISLLERGKRRATVHTIFTICDQLKVKPSNFITEVEGILLKNEEI